MADPGFVDQSEFTVTVADQANYGDRAMQRVMLMVTAPSQHDAIAFDGRD